MEVGWYDQNVHGSGVHNRLTFAGRGELVVQVLTIISPLQAEVGRE